MIQEEIGLDVSLEALLQFLAGSGSEDKDLAADYIRMELVGGEDVVWT